MHSSPSIARISQAFLGGIVAICFLAGQPSPSEAKPLRADADADGDGLSTWTELRRTRTNPRRADSDRDRLSDGVEVKRTRTSPRRADTDGDGLSDWTELRRMGTNPRRADSDGDGVGDGEEVLAGSDPRDPASVPVFPPGSPAPAPSPDPEGPEEEEPPAPPPPDTTPPETTITSSPPGATSASATFTFSGSDAGGSGVVSFECRRDGGPWAACTSPREYAGLAEGAHSFEVKAIDSAGNTDPSPASFDWQIDTTPPTVQINAGPSGLTNNPSPTFGFSSEPGAGFECSIDSGTLSFGPCSGASTHTPASPLSEGPHTFRVRAIDGAGNQAIATRSFTVDTTAPPAPELTSTSPASPANHNNPQVIGSAQVSTTVKLYAGADCSGSPVATSSAAELEAGIAVSVTDNSTTSFRATATTAAENTSGCSEPLVYVEDSSAPDTQIDAKPAALTNSATANFTFSGNDGTGLGVASFECRRDGGAWVPCTSPQEYAGLGEGAHSFEVKAIDSAGNVDATPATFDWTVDLTAPQVTIGSLSKALLKAGETSEASWHADENGTFELRVGGADCSAGTVIDSGAYDNQPTQHVSNVTAAQLAEGANTLRLCLADAAGNRGSATTTLSRDTGAPETQIDAKPTALTNSTAAKFEFSGSDPGGSGVASFECRRDGGAWAACTSPREYAGLSEGAHSFEVKAIDNAGNVDTSPASFDWQIDTTLPAVQVNSGPSDLTNNPSPTFGFSSEPGAGFECSIDTGTLSFGPCSGLNAHTPAAPLAEGPHTFRVRAIDGAGNQAIATRSFTVDTTAPPAPELTSTSPASPANDNDPLVIGSAPADTTVKLYVGADCSGSPVATRSAAELEAGIAVSVTDDSTTDFRATSTTVAENTSGCSEPLTYVEDSSAPDTQIDAKPAALANSTVASFTFSGNDGSGSGVASFECRRDSGGWAACTSPREYAGLSEGAHSFEVKAIDQAGNVDASPATFDWTVDLTAPQVTVDSLSKTLLKAGETSEASWHADENGTFELRVGGADCSAGTVIDSGAYDNQPAQHVSNVTAAQLAEGANTLRLCLADAAGNRGSATTALSRDTGAPSTQIDANPPALSTSSTANFTFSGSDPGGSGVASFECRRDSGGWAACTSPREYAGLSDGAHSFEVKAIDSAGNTDPSPASFDWQIDTTPPTAQVDSGPSGLTNNPSPTFGFSSEPGASFECSIDSGTPDFGPCSGASTHTPASPLAEGPHTFRVRATDGAGNQAIATRSFSVDTTAPGAPGLTATAPGSPANHNNPQVIGTAPADTTVKLYAGADCSGSPFATVSVAELEAGIAVSVPDNSTTSFRATSTTAAENTSGCSEPLAYVEDSSAPDTTIDTHPASLTNSAMANFTFSGNDGAGSGVASFECRRDSGAWAACTSPREYAGLAEGAHSFEVKAIDQAGNVDASPATFDWTVDLTAPQVTIDSLSKTLLKAGQTSEVSWHADENGGFELRVGGADCSAGTVIDSGPYADQPAQHVSNVTAAQLAEGANTLRLCLADAAGNRGSATTALSRDTGAPSTQIDANPPALSTSSTANFTFSGSDPGGSGVSSFECRRDGGAWAACTSPREYTGLAEGAHSFEVKAIDQAGNADGTPVSFNWTVDSAAPDTQIDAKPPTLANSSSATFTFSGSDPAGSGVASFECRRDSGVWAACTSPREYAGLSEGAHSFEVKAIDSAGNTDPSPASFDWQIDTTPPAVQVNSGPSGLTNNPSPTFGFSSEPGASFECSIDTGSPDFGPCSGLNAHTPAAPLAEGPHTFRVRATDAVANQAIATRSFSVDTTAPPAPQLSSTVPASPANDNDPQVIGTAPAATTIKLYAGADCSGSPFATVSAAELEAGIAVSVPDNSTTSFRATATTAAENTSGCSEPQTYVEDSSAPDTTIDTHPAALTNSAMAKFAFSGNDGASSGITSFECRRDGGSWAACTSPREYAGLSEGAHDFEVKAIDQAGNVDEGPATFDWTVDLTAPQVAIDSLSKTLLKAGQTSEATWHADENGGFELRGGGADCNTGTVIDSGPYANQSTQHVSNVTAAQLAEGANTVRLCVTDAAGNRGQATTTLSKDTGAPETAIDAKPAVLTSSTAAKFEFSGSDPPGSGVASFECRRDGGGWAACTSPREYAGLAEGAHSFEVKAIDNAGNVDTSPASFDWQIDTTPPAVQVNSGPSDLTNNPSPTFGFSSEPGAGFECSIDTGSPTFGPCSGASTHTPASPLSEGPHTFRVRATDGAGNQAIATRSFTVDTTAPPAPELTSTSPASPANDNDPQVIGSAQASTTVKLYVGADCSGSPVATVSAAELEAGIAVSVADNSTTVFRATVTTAERTSGCSEPLAYVEDSSVPETTIASAPPATTMSTSATIFFEASEPNSSFECKLDGAAFAGCVSPLSYADLAPGEHSFSVRATDAAGNMQPTSTDWSWTVESPPSPSPSGCAEGGTVAVTALEVRAAVADDHDVCVTADTGNVDLSNLGARSVVVSTNGGSMGEVDLDSTTDLTISRARFRSIEMRGSHRTKLLDNTIGGTPANRVLDQLIFMPEISNDVTIERNDIGWTIADASGNTGYGCRCYGDLNRLRFVGNKLHDLAADGFQGVGGNDVLIDRNEIGPVGRNPESDEHSDNIQITGNGENLRITNNWLHHQGYYEGGVTANSGSTYIHGGSMGSLIYENNLIETAQGRTEICGLGTGGEERSNLTIRRNTWVDGGLAFNGFPGFEWDCDSGSGNTVERNIAVDPDGGLKMSSFASAATFSANLWGQPSLVTLDAAGNCTSANCNPAGEEPIGYRKPSPAPG